MEVETQTTRTWQQRSDHARAMRRRGGTQMSVNTGIHREFVRCQNDVREGRNVNHVEFAPTKNGVSWV